MFIKLTDSLRAVPTKKTLLHFKNKLSTK